MVGCASHRFNFAVTQYFQQYGTYNKLEFFDDKLKNVKLLAKRRKLTTFHPLINNVTN